MIEDSKTVSKCRRCCRWLRAIFDEDTVTQIMLKRQDLTRGDWPGAGLALAYGLIAVFLGFVLLILRYTALYDEMGSALFSEPRTQFKVTYELMWIVHLILWGLATAYWPLTYIPNNWCFALFYVKWYDHGGNWAGAIVGSMLAFSFLMAACKDPNSATVTTLVLYLVIMVG